MQSVSSILAGKYGTGFKGVTGKENVMNKTKIDWCTDSWNPVTGCQHGCEYCYARGIATRFGGWTTNGVKTTANFFKDPPELDKPLMLERRDGKVVCAPYPFGFAPTLHRYRLSDVSQKQQPRNIFVCSMADLFGAWVPDGWIKEVFDACLVAPQHNYLFLTKNPERYNDLDRKGLLPQGKNFWYGATTANSEQMEQAADAFGQLSSRTRTFFSMEPLMEDIAACNGWAYAGNGKYANWIIVGAMTGPASKGAQPSREWVEKIVRDADLNRVPVFMKGNLAGVWGVDLVQKFPREMWGRC